MMGISYHNFSAMGRQICLYSPLCKCALNRKERTKSNKKLLRNSNMEMKIYDILYSLTYSIAIVNDRVCSVGLVYGSDSCQSLVLPVDLEIMT